jgi:hypothetical protein
MERKKKKRKRKKKERKKRGEKEKGTRDYVILFLILRERVCFNNKQTEEHHLCARCSLRSSQPRDSFRFSTRINPLLQTKRALHTGLDAPTHRGTPFAKLQASLLRPMFLCSVAETANEPSQWSNPSSAHLNYRIFAATKVSSRSHPTCPACYQRIRATILCRGMAHNNFHFTLREIAAIINKARHRALAIVMTMALVISFVKLFLTHGKLLSRNSSWVICNLQERERERGYYVVRKNNWRKTLGARVLICPRNKLRRLKKYEYRLPYLIPTASNRSIKPV